MNGPDGHVLVAGLGQLVVDDLRHALGGSLDDLLHSLLNHLRRDLGGRHRRGLLALGLRLRHLLLHGLIGGLGLGHQHLLNLGSNLRGHHGLGRRLDVPVLVAACREQQVGHAAVDGLYLDAGLAHERLGALGADQGQHVGVVLTTVLAQILEPALLCQAPVGLSLGELLQQAHAEGIEGNHFVASVGQGVCRSDSVLKLVGVLCHGESRLDFGV